MKLKSLKIKKKKQINFNQIFFKFYFFASIAFLFSLLILFLNTGIWENFKNKYEERIYLNGIYNYKFIPKVVYFKFNNLFLNHKKIYINVNQKNLLKLEKNRKDILDYVGEDSTKPFKHDIPFVDAKAIISSDDQEFETSIRLKGDRQIHFKDKKNSSYKFKLKNDFTLNSANVFSLQKPRIRNYLHEWIFHELLSLGGLVTLKYDFFDVYINGKYIGFYTFEENFGKILIEKNSRRYGPVFSLYEQFDTKDEKKIKFEVYDEKYWNKIENFTLLTNANSKLKKIIDKEANLEEIFDLKKWAWFFAVADLGYTYHGVLTKSVKFFYNPVTGKFEPIGYDGHRLVPNFYNISQNKYFPDLNKILFDNLNNNISFAPSIENIFFYKKNGEINYEFYDEYLEALKKITSKNFLINFFKERKDKINQYSSGIYADDYKYDYNSNRRSGIGIYFFREEEYYRRATQIRDILKPNISKTFITEKESLFEIENNYFFNYNLHKITFDCGVKKIKINKKMKDKVFVEKDQNFKGLNCNKVTFENRIDNTKYEKTIDKHNIKISNDNVSDKTKFLKYFEKKNSYLLLKSDQVIIDENIVIPKNLIVKILPGQKIILINNAYITSKSPFIVGGDGKRTLISGFNDNYGGGLIIETNNQYNSIKNTEIKNLNGTAFKKIFDDKIIFGSLNFINSDVEIDNTNFQNIKSEDALNIISSKFLIKNTNFNNIKSDAIDIDFGSGKMQNLYFENIMNDAIDFSGSTAEIEKLFFKNIGDKLVSVGEKSYIQLKKAYAVNSNVGIASKDKSELIAKDLEFNNVKYPFAAYKKKNEYGGANLYLSNFKINNSITDFVYDKNSLIANYNNKIQKFKNSPNSTEIILKISR